MEYDHRSFSSYINIHMNVSFKALFYIETMVFRYQPINFRDAEVQYGFDNWASFTELAQLERVCRVLGEE